MNTQNGLGSTGPPDRAAFSRFPASKFYGLPAFGISRFRDHHLPALANSVTTPMANPNFRLFPHSEFPDFGSSGFRAFGFPGFRVNISKACLEPRIQQVERDLANAGGTRLSGKGCVGKQRQGGHRGGGRLAGSCVDPGRGGGARAAATPRQRGGHRGTCAPGGAEIVTQHRLAVTGCLGIGLPETGISCYRASGIPGDPLCFRRD